MGGGSGFSDKGDTTSTNFDAHVVDETLEELVQSDVCSQLVLKMCVDVHRAVRACGLRSQCRPSCTASLHASAGTTPTTMSAQLNTL